MKTTKIIALALKAGAKTAADLAQFLKRMNLQGRK